MATNYQGKRLNSPNDVICSRNGDVFFTDPPYGLRQPDGTFLPGELGFSGVFRVSEADGSVSLLADDLAKPNGLVLRDGGKQLLIDDTDNHVVRIFDIGPDGVLSEDRVFADISYENTVGRPDGMKLDGAGNLYVAANTEEGVWVFGPEGGLLGLTSDLCRKPPTMPLASNTSKAVTLRAAITRIGGPQMPGAGRITWSSMASSSHWLRPLSPPFTTTFSTEMRHTLTPACRSFWARSAA